MTLLLAAGLLAGCGKGALLSGATSPLARAFEQGQAGDAPAAPPAQFEPAVAAALASMPTSNNRFAVLPDRIAFPELERTLAGARRSILISVYNWRMDETGLRIADLVYRKAQQGVEVRILVDEYGQTEQKGDKDMVPWLRRHGLDVRHYRKTVLFPRGILNFSHRKLYLVDGDQAVTGGMNLGHEYELLWRDLLVKVEGEIAGQLHKEWLRDWTHSGGPAVKLQPVAARAYGRVTAAAIATSPLEPGRGNEIHRVLLTAIRTAKKRVWAAYPYWGDKALVDELGKAAKRGVDVRVIIPEVTDVPVFKVANRFIVKELLDRGVKVRLFSRGFAHAKYLVADDLLEIGSSNADTSSFENQQELDVITPDPQITEQFVAAGPALDWVANCRDVRPDDLKSTWAQAPTEEVLKLIRRFL
ncbi:MAG: phosphatidylserine/phosphatidylglycerophosphate/cardiolipin synthase family protein [Candidatus Sericytochromatia bacterium]|nr:phosphatidylserine/phosphatidylglycerophosphate/cardiolipin synthase family protein [Candidatus Tanganyikabacteria bacterium]